MPDQVKRSVSSKEPPKGEEGLALQALSVLALSQKDAWNRFVAEGAGYPVGSVFFSAVATDPSVLLGMGTWSALADGDIDVGGTPVGVWVWQRTA